MNESALPFEFESMLTLLECRRLTSSPPSSSSTSSFAYATVGELFNEADRNRDGHVSYEEWVRFAIDHPSIVDAIFFRLRDIAAERYTAPTISAEDIIVQRRMREMELDRMYRESQYLAERGRVQREYEDAKREAELARARAAAAADREKALLDRLYFTPSSPKFSN
jgi:hypothetical protein